VTESSLERNGRTTVESLEGRQLAGRLSEGVVSFAQGMFDVIAGEIEEVGSDPETVALTLAPSDSLELGHRDARFAEERSLLLLGGRHHMGGGNQRDTA
jgi:hypothetical protein